MIRPLLSIRVDIRITGRPAEAWGVDVKAEDVVTPTQLAAAIDGAFAKLKTKVEEVLK